MIQCGPGSTIGLPAYVTELYVSDILALFKLLKSKAYLVGLLLLYCLKATPTLVG